MQSSPGVHKGYEYGRTQNPTRMAYERCIADLESGTRGYAFASGLAAEASLLELFDAGSHIVASDDLYGGTYRLFRRVRARGYQSHGGHFFYGYGYRQSSVDFHPAYLSDLAVLFQSK